MNPDNTKSALQSLGMVAPMVGIAIWAIKTSYGVEIPIDVQGQVIDVLNVAIPAVFMLAAWGRKRAKAVIDRWF